MRSRAMRKATQRYLWDRLKVSLWFVPLLMTVAAFILSWLLGRLDAQVPNELLIDSKLIITAGATEMRAIMIAMAGTILATTGVVFSLLTLPLSTVAAQFGSRLLRIFLRDRTTQVVLGIFVGTFSYCLATALAIPLNDAQAELPQISVTFGLVLSLATFASLIALIQHISMMLQAPNIVSAAGAELMEVVKVENLDERGRIQLETGENLTASLIDADAYPLKANRRGYVQFIDPEIILNLAEDKDLIIRLVRKPGEFVWSGETVALVWPAARVDKILGRNLGRAVQVGNQRTPTQDIEYAVNQLVEVAVRAMSPAINDPFTAMTCLDHLADGLSNYVQNGESSPYFFDKEGKLRLVFEPATLTQLLGAAFDLQRHACSDNATLLLHMLDAIDIIGQNTNSTKARAELLRHVQLVRDESQAGNLIEADKQCIYQRSETLGKELITAGI